MVTMCVTNHSYCFFPSDDQEFHLHRNLKVFGAASVPVGDFAASIGSRASFAALGFGFGIELTTEVVRGFELGVFGVICHNAMSKDEVATHFRKLLGRAFVGTSATNWQLLWLAGEAGLRSQLSTSSDFYARSNLGVLWGNGPEFSISTAPPYPERFSQSSASGTGLAYGFAAGIIVKNRFDIGIRFLAAQPAYNITQTSYYYSGTKSGSIKAGYSHATSIILLAFGFVM
jgi:hypothetical protein